MKQENSRSFAPFAETLINGGSYTNVLHTLKKISSFNVAFLSKDGDLYIDSESDTFTEHLRTFPKKELLRLYENRDVLHNETSVGHLVIEKPHEGEELDEKSIGNSLLALELLIEKENYALKIERRYREQYVQDLLFSRIKHEEELHNRATVFGWNLKGPVTAVVATPVTPEEIQEIIPAVRHRLRAFYPKLIFTDIGAQATFLVPGGPEKQKDIFETCRYIRDELSPLKVRIGIGDPRSSFLMAGESYKEACQAIEVMDKFLQDWAIARWDELGAYKILSSLSRNEDARNFTVQKLKPLIDYDYQHNTDLMETLLVIDRSNWNLRSASETMYVHYNTVKYRFKKICEILELNSEDSEQRFAMSLSLRIYRISIWNGKSSQL